MLNQPYIIGRKTAPLARIKVARTVGAKRDVPAPRQQPQRQVERGCVASERHQRFITMLPCVAIWTVVNPAAIHLRETGALREQVHAPGGEEENSGADPRPRSTVNLKPFFAARRVDDGVVT